ncbi:diguanylate cyclase (GGDEF) domain-containing protein [Ectothiorhodospira mobilis]|uniref:diguanylate cyclase n=2 Tax=Ectothiorhodospira mobilis TaxID=195064 RepID=A0A1I4SZB7_ECTMO|nr:GGDEF domain-containing protein [Ectothiorhodospira mobilis]SFM69737.1 diguanylate cyclase (GGDEF) domain-containing protein [Ectothiorhodospira mobilis]
MPRDPWFWVAALSSTLLLFILVWSLLYSFSVVDAFAEEKLALEQASGGLLYHIKRREMAVQLAVATGDLRWQDRHRHSQQQLTALTGRVAGLVDTPAVAERVAALEGYVATTRDLARQAFHHVSRGELKTANDLVKGWTYLKAELDLEETAQALTDTLRHEVRARATLERATIASVLVLAMMLIAVAVSSFAVAIRGWLARQQRRQEREARHRYLSYHDPLTGLPNRRYFKECFGGALALARRHHHDTAVMMVDVDHFKQLNDTQGHAVGDQVLVHLAAALQEDLRQSDLPARLGGEEFGILLPETGRQEAVKIAERVRQRVVECPPRVQGIRLPVTVSIGVAAVHGHVDPEVLLERADRALYRAKEQGRNRVVCH